MSKINKVYLLSFLFTLHISLSAYVNSTFLTKIISEKYVGILFTIAAIITLYLLSTSARLLKEFGNRTMVLWLLLLNMMALVGMINSLNPIVIAISFIVLSTTNSLVLFSLDIFIEHFSNPKTIGKTHGLYLTITNLAWMLSPLITATLITREGGFITIYKVALTIAVLMSLGLVSSVKRFTDKKYEKTPFLETYGFLRKNKHILAITMINFLLQFFFAMMVVYTPIYLTKHIGLSWDDIGVIFTIMLAPFVIFGLPVGLVIDRYHIKKSTLIAIGFIIMIISTLSMSFINTASLTLWAIVLFLTRTGAAIVETASEIYFFAHAKEEEAYLLSVFRDMTPVALVIAPTIATLVFVFFPFNYLFAILAVIMLSSFYYIPHLRHNHVGLNTNK
ncbi:MAG: MFS transporter [bacterium]